MTNLGFIDVSGVGNSGKSAAVDLLREFDGIFVPHFQFEFDFLRVRGGLIDLRHALLEDWSPVRSHAAFKAFLKVTSRMGRNPRAWWDVPAWIESTSQRYDRHFFESFQGLTQTFARSFVIGSYLAEWPYDDLCSSPVQVFMRKFIRRFGGRRKLLREVFLLDGTDFDKQAYAYLTQLFQKVVPKNINRVILNNGFEPFNPVPFLDMLDGSRQIVVTRDPRDVYVSGQNNHHANAADKKLFAFDNDGLNKSFLAADDIELFVCRYRLYHQHLFQGTDKRVLRLRFEDLVLDYESVVARVLAFLDLPPEKHVSPRLNFDPTRSRENVGVWRKYSKHTELRFIEAQLEEFLVSD